MTQSQVHPRCAMHGSMSIDVVYSVLSGHLFVGDSIRVVCVCRCCGRGIWEMQ